MFFQRITITVATVDLAKVYFVYREDKTRQLNDLDILEMPQKKKKKKSSSILQNLQNPQMF